MDAEMYTDILGTDNDSKHTSERAKQWLEDNGFEVLAWPAQSPDPDAIEHLGAILKRRLARYAAPPKGTAELWDRVAVEWGQITVEECAALVGSMPAAVLKAKSGNRSYAPAVSYSTGLLT